MNAYRFQSKNWFTRFDARRPQEMSVRTPAPSTPARRAFSLPELLIVIAIIGVMATLLLAVAQKAQEDARASATRSRIARLEAILNQELDAYEVRRLPVSNQVLLAAASGNNAVAAVAFRNLRRRILQDLINAEFPRPAMDGDGNLIRNPELGVFPTARAPAIPGLVPSSAVIAWQDVRFNDLRFDHPSEYLYEILQRIDKDGVPAIETLGGSAFGDTDNDGFLEILDGWNEPLLFDIVQVQVVDSTAPIVEDVPVVDWIRKDPVTGMPTGFEPLNPAIPRDLSQIRFRVYSARLLAIDN